MGAAWLMAGWFVLSGGAAETKPSYPRSIPLPAGCPEPVYEQVKVTARDETALVIHEWAPPRVPAGKPVVVLIHGIGMHGEPYAAIAAGFTAQGITLIAPDLRGHGRSEGAKGELAEPRVLRADLGSILDAVNKRHPDSPVFLMGESMGGLIAADYAVVNQKRLAGLILLAPAFKLHRSRFQVPVSGLQPSPEVVEFFTTGLIVIDTPENLKASTREAGFIKAKQDDPLCTRAVKPAYVATIALMQLDWPNAAAKLRLPLLICVPGKDEIIDSKGAERAFARAATAKEDKKWQSFEAARHTLFWDPDTPAVVQNITDWVMSRPKHSEPAK